MNDLSYIFCYYDQPGMLRRHMEEIDGYDPELLHHLDVVVIDDGSPTHPAVDVLCDFRHLPVRLFRVLENIPWNQPGGRNLAMSQVRNDWVFCTDVDHTLPRVHLAKTLEYPFQQGTVYYPERKVAWTYEDQVFAPNIFFIHRKDFADCYGYDEDYCGRKGWSDVCMRHVLEDMGKKLFHKVPGLVVHAWSNLDPIPCELLDHPIPDACVVNLDRSVHENAVMHKQNFHNLRKWGWRAYLSKLTLKEKLRFKWEEVELG